MSVRPFIGLVVRMVGALGSVVAGVALSEAFLRRRYVERISRMDVPEEADQQILTYPLA